MTPRLRRALPSFLGAALAVGIPTLAFAHAKLITPTPRSPRDDIKGNTTCGAPTDNPADAAVATYVEGQEIDVSFVETIQHVGCFVVNLLENGETKSTQVYWQEDTDAPITTHNVKVKLPAGVACAKCTLQLDQVMAGTVCAPKGAVPDASTYHSCASIRITYADGGVPPEYDGGTAGNGSPPPPGSGTGKGTGTGTGTGTGDHDGMDHDDTNADEDGTKATDDGADTEPKTALCSVQTVGAPVGAGALLLVGVGVAFTRRRRRR